MNVYRVTRTVEVEAESAEDAVLLADDMDLAEPSIVLQVRREPFDVPSPMWTVVEADPDTLDVRLRRLR